MGNYQSTCNYLFSAFRAFICFALKLLLLSRVHTFWSLPHDKCNFEWQLIAAVIFFFVFKPIVLEGKKEFFFAIFTLCAPRIFNARTKNVANDKFFFRSLLILHFKLDFTPVFLPSYFVLALINSSNWW